jgi:hypothetical protein
MRALPNDPARSVEARAKLSASVRIRMRAIRAWEREHGREVDRRGMSARFCLRSSNSRCRHSWRQQG